MKKITFTIFIVFTLFSCTTYYQIYNVTPFNEMEIHDDYIVFENEDCRVLYDMWAEGGSSSYMLLNLTEENLYIHLDECFFVLNDYAYDLFKGREFSSNYDRLIAASQTEKSTANVTGLNNFKLLQTNQLSITNTLYSSLQVGKEIRYKEKKVICIPPFTYKMIPSYNIQDRIIKYCEMEEYPNENKGSTLEFTDENTPLLFENIISYSLDSVENLKNKIRNSFYVDAIENYHKNSIFEPYDIMDCGKVVESSKYNIMMAPYRFYNVYGVDE